MCRSGTLNPTHSRPVMLYVLLLFYCIIVAFFVHFNELIIGIIAAFSPSRFPTNKATVLQIIWSHWVNLRLAVCWQFYF